MLPHVCNHKSENSSNEFQFYPFVVIVVGKFIFNCILYLITLKSRMSVSVKREKIFRQGKIFGRKIVMLTRATLVIKNEDKTKKKAVEKFWSNTL